MHRLSLLISVAVALLSHPICSHGKTQVNTDSIRVVIQKIETRLINLEGIRENLDGRFENKADALDLQVERINLELQSDYNFIKWLTLTFGSVTIFGVLALAFSIFRYVNRTAKIKVNEKFDQLFDSEKDRLIQLIEKQSEENQLKKLKRILVISDPLSKDEFIKKFFNKMGFENIHFLKSEESGQLEAGKQDVVFFNCEEVEMSQSTMDNYIMNESPNTLFFYFGKSKFSNATVNDRLAMANQRTQLYGNLINALKFSNLL